MSSPPSKLGKYDIVRALGEGAMGTVYEAVDSVIERTVAIKTIRKSELDAEESAEHARRFLIEAKAAGKLNHPHIVSLYDHGDEAGLAYIVMELVQGRELQHYFDEKYAFSLADVVRLMGELLDALGYSHRRGVVHRDVKPANIFITDTGSVKLGDFGIARIESSQKTRAGAVVGTPSYMSPEQIRGEAADARSDLYAAGVVLYQFLTGERPYTGNMLAMALKVLNEPVPLPSAIQPDVSPQLDAVVLRALAKQAKDRYQTAAEFWQALAEAVGLVVTPAPALSALSGSGASGFGERSRLGTATSFGSKTTVGRDLGREAVKSEQVLLSPGSTRAPTPGLRPRGDPDGSVPFEGAGPAASSRPRWIVALTAALIALGAAGWWLSGRDPSKATIPMAKPDTGSPAASDSPITNNGPASAAMAGPSASMPPSSAPASAPSTLPPPVTQAAPPASSTTLPAAPPSSAAMSPTAPVATSSAAASTSAASASSLSPAAADAASPAGHLHGGTPSGVAGTAGTAGDARNGSKHAAREARPAQPHPAVEPAPTATPPKLKPARPARCSDILQKASLEPLSAEEGAYLRRECQ